MSSLRRLSVAAAGKPSEQRVRQRLEWLMADPAAVTEELVATRLAIYRRPGAAAAMERVLCLQDPEVRARNLLSPADWGRVGVPTLVLWGDADATGPQETGARLAGWLPRGTFAPLDHAGHWPQHESPQAVAAAVTAFLDDAPSAVLHAHAPERTRP
jgi:2-hydroxy-6-oxonona-2,4-dienedioate hydrolase